MTPPWTLTTVAADALEDAAPDLAALLLACVRDGASIGFIEPFDLNQALAFWRGPVAAGLRAGTRDLLVVREGVAGGGTIIGTVQLNRDMPANQRHRADVAKLLVHPQARRRGIARQLMLAVEERARSLGLDLLILDTRAGDAGEPLYRALGYQVTGVVPGYARAPGIDAREACIFFHKPLI